MQTIAIVDYGMGNLRSVLRALQHVVPQDRVLITDKPEQVCDADRVVFPGQGAMPDCMRSLTESGLSEAVREAAVRRPFLGICVGEHMLLESSDESNGPSGTATVGLGLIRGHVRRLPGVDADGRILKVPHMGWNRVDQHRSHALWHDVPDSAYFYFVHSYYAELAIDADIAGQTEYGVRFTSALARDNIFATQFHPEKSAAIGLQIYRNFVNWKP